MPVVITVTHTKYSFDQAVEMIINAKRVIITPGYGLTVVKAQFVVAEMTKWNQCTFWN